MNSTGFNNNCVFSVNQIATHLQNIQDTVSKLRKVYNITIHSLKGAGLKCTWATNKRLPEKDLEGNNGDFSGIYESCGKE